MQSSQSQITPRPSPHTIHSNNFLSLSVAFTHLSSYIRNYCQFPIIKKKPKIRKLFFFFSIRLVVSNYCRQLFFIAWKAGWRGPNTLKLIWPEVNQLYTALSDVLRNVVSVSEWSIYIRWKLKLFHSLDLCNTSFWFYKIYQYIDIHTHQPDGPSTFLVR